MGIWPYKKHDADDVAESYRIADLVLAEVDRIPDVSEMVEASSLGTAEAKAARDSVTDEQAQRAIDIANRIRAASAAGGAERYNALRKDQTEEAAYWAGLDETDGGAAAPPADAAGVPAPVAPAPTGSAAESATTTAAPPSPRPAESTCICLCARHDLQPCGCYCNRHPLTDDGVAAPGEAPALATEAVPPGPVVTPRPFLLFRITDVTGLSGQGVVAWGTQWPDGTVALRWCTSNPSSVHWDSLDALIAVHGHGGATVVKWLAGAA